MSAVDEVSDDSNSEALEILIRDKGQEAVRLASDGNSLAARRCYVEMADLVARRSPETVARLERERGLR